MSEYIVKVYEAGASWRAVVETREKADDVAQCMSKVISWETVDILLEGRVVGCFRNGKSVW